MRRVQSVSIPWRRHDRHRSRHAAAAGAALWLCLVSTCSVATPSCSVSAPGLAFGNYDVFAVGVTNGTGTLSITCNLNPPPGSATVNYTISLSTGSSNSFVQRQMKSGGNTLGYNLYTSNTHSVIWGDGTGTSKTVAGSMSLTTPTPSKTNRPTIYGQIPPLQDAAVANNYSDTITVTVTY